MYGTFGPDVEADQVPCPPFGSLPETGTTGRCQWALRDWALGGIPGRWRQGSTWVTEE